MSCDCITKINKKLEAVDLALKLWQIINTKTLEVGQELALETISLKKGFKPKTLFMPFCPFCGKRRGV